MIEITKDTVESPMMFELSDLIQQNTSIPVNFDIWHYQIQIGPEDKECVFLLLDRMDEHDVVENITLETQESDVLVAFDKYWRTEQDFFDAVLEEMVLLEKYYKFKKGFPRNMYLNYNQEKHKIKKLLDQNSELDDFGFFENIKSWKEFNK